MKQTTAEKITTMLQKEAKSKLDVLLITHDENEIVSTMVNGHMDGIAASIFSILADNENNPDAAEPILGIIQSVVYNMIAQKVYGYESILGMIAALAECDDIPSSQDKQKAKIVDFPIGEA